MSLAIYEGADPNTKYSVSGNFSNPFAESIDGRTGGTIERRMYVRNDSGAYTYSGIKVQSVSFTGRDITGGDDGFYWKLKSGSTRPTSQEWSTISGHNQITLGDLGTGVADISTYLPFWLQITVPAGVDIQTFSGTTIRITATELVV